MPEQVQTESSIADTQHHDRDIASIPMEEWEHLRNQVESAEKDRDEYRDLLQRSQADFENQRKRNQREITEELRYANTPFVRDLLPVVDNIQRAVDSARGGGTVDALIEGLMRVQSQLHDLLTRFGITAITPLGETFDPYFHEAIGQEPRSDVPPGTIVSIMEPGYQIHERILRPARVIVAVAAPASP